MTHQDVREELGVFDRFLDGGIGGGPRNRSWVGRSLRPGCGISLVFDYTTQPPRLVEAQLVGDGWSE
ncbi:hypothetical protein AB1L88_16120 [Tautonia sp. JC769]|uniref:hypothetical protein n=1 Tax=Tautonia sp. JC769 TaxID=3232135 RepID=UPI003457E3EC